MTSKNRRRGKDMERFLARYLKGERVGILGNEDVRFNYFSAETKERKSLPKFLKDCMAQAEANCPDRKIPFVVLHELNKSHKEDLVILRLPHWRKFVLWKEKK